MLDSRLTVSAADPLLPFFGFRFGRWGSMIFRLQVHSLRLSVFGLIWLRQVGFTPWVFGRLPDWVGDLLHSWFSAPYAVFGFRLGVEMMSAPRIPNGGDRGTGNAGSGRTMEATFSGQIGVNSSRKPPGLRLNTTSHTHRWLLFSSTDHAAYETAHELMFLPLKRIRSPVSSVENSMWHGGCFPKETRACPPRRRSRPKSTCVAECMPLLNRFP